MTTPRVAKRLEAHERQVDAPRRKTSESVFGRYRPLSVFGLDAKPRFGAVRSFDRLFR